MNIRKHEYSNLIILISRSHHHQSRCPTLHSIAPPRARSEETTLLGSAEGVSFAVNAAVHLEVVVSQVSLAVCASQTSWVEFLLPFALEILALNALVTAAAHTPVQFVVMVF